MEAFMGYFVTEYLRSQDTQFGIWMLVGMIVRIAFRMGCEFPFSNRIGGVC